MRSRNGNRLGAMIPLQLAQFAHELRVAGGCMAHDDAFADDAAPKESDRDCDRSQTLSCDFRKWHRSSLRANFKQSTYQ